MRRLLLWAIFGLAVLAVVGMWASLRSYRIFAQEDWVAVVSCRSAPPGSDVRFLLEVASVSKGVPGRERIFPMQGDQWTIGGDIVKWKPWLSFLGLKSCHKLTRLNSRYVLERQERAGPHSVHELDGGSPMLWRWLQRSGVRLPFVDAVYGSASYVPARRGGRWGVYVTASGYFIRPLRDSSGGAG